MTTALRLALHMEDTSSSAKLHNLDPEVIHIMDKDMDKVGSKLCMGGQMDDQHQGMDKEELELDQALQQRQEGTTLDTAIVILDNSEDEEGWPAHNSLPGRILELANATDTCKGIDMEYMEDVVDISILSSSSSSSSGTSIMFAGIQDARR